MKNEQQVKLFLKANFYLKYCIFNNISKNTPEVNLNPNIKS